MSRTIVQDYGPIYGEAVNGTVMGRPNGSVYVPLSNTIEIDFKDLNYVYVREYGSSPTAVIICDSAGKWSGVPALVKMAACAQDLASKMQIQIFSDEELTDLLGFRNLTAGIFNYETGYICNGVDPGTIEAGEPYYMRAQLMNNNTPVATSNTLTFTGWEA